MSLVALQLYPISLCIALTGTHTFFGSRLALDARKENVERVNFERRKQTEMYDQTRPTGRCASIDERPVEQQSECSRELLLLLQPRVLPANRIFFGRLGTVDPPLAARDGEVLKETYVVPPFL